MMEWKWQRPMICDEEKKDHIENRCDRQTLEVVAEANLGSRLYALPVLILRNPWFRSQHKRSSSCSSASQAKTSLLTDCFHHHKHTTSTLSSLRQGTEQSTLFLEAVGTNRTWIQNQNRPLFASLSEKKHSVLTTSVRARYLGSWKHDSHSTNDKTRLYHGYLQSFRSVMDSQVGRG